MPPASPLPLREALLCLVRHQDHLLGAVVIRQGLSFTLLTTLLDHKAALLHSPEALELLSRELELPVRTLDPDNSSFLARQTLLARRAGRGSWHLRG